MNACLRDKWADQAAKTARSMKARADLKLISQRITSL
jgi:hypothetical protein